MSKQLIPEQRYAIYLGLARKQRKKDIAQEIGVHPSTVTREIQRNSNRHNRYVFTVAQEQCESRKHSTLGNYRKEAILWWRVEQMIQLFSLTLHNRLHLLLDRTSHQNISVYYSFTEQLDILILVCARKF